MCLLIREYCWLISLRISTLKIIKSCIREPPPLTILSTFFLKSWLPSTIYLSNQSKPLFFPSFKILSRFLGCPHTLFVVFLFFIAYDFSRYFEIQWGWPTLVWLYEVWDQANANISRKIDYFFFIGFKLRIGPLFFLALNQLSRAWLNPREFFFT